MINLARVTERTLAIQRIPAPTFQEAQRAEYLHNEFVAAGASAVEMDTAGNVFARVGPKQGRPIVVSAHMDTVFAREAVSAASQREGRLYGPGVGDNAVALATLFELLEHYQRAPTGQPLWLVANVGEEGLGNLVGMEHVVERFGAAALAYIVLEGMALGFVYHQGLPVRRFRLSAATEGGHAWIHAGRPSAIHTLIKIGNQLLKISRPHQRPFSINIGRIEGGHSVNSIASSASFELDLRAREISDLEKFMESMVKTIEKQQTDSVQLRLEAIGHRPAGKIEKDHALVRNAVDALQAAGFPQVKLDIGSTDASLPLSLGLPAVCIGLTRGGEAHSQQEFIELAPLSQGFEALVGLIDRVAQKSSLHEDSD